MEQHRLSVFENMVLGRIFVPKREEITGEWTKLCNELHNVFSLQNIWMIKMIYLYYRAVNFNVQVFSLLLHQSTQVNMEIGPLNQCDASITSFSGHGT
jgi:hypothetical protein